MIDTPGRKIGKVIPVELDVDTIMKELIWQEGFFWGESMFFPGWISTI